MFKTIRRVFYITIILALVSIAYCWTQRAGLLSHYLSNAAGVPVSVDALDIGFGGVAIEKFSISNPRGSTLPTAFSTDSFTVNYRPWKMVSSPHEIDDIIVKNIVVNVEQHKYISGKSNWAVITDNLAAQSKGKKDKKAVAPAGKKGRVVIKHLLLENITIDVIHPLLGKIHTTIPKIEMNNLGEAGSFSPDMLMKIVFDAMMRELLTHPDLKKGLEGMVELPTKILEGVFKGGEHGAIDIKENLKGAGRVLKEEGKKLEEVLESFGDFFKNLAPAEDSDQ